MTFFKTAGAGTKTLVVPSRSKNFEWTASQVASTCRGYVYILATDELLCDIKKEEELEVCERNVVNPILME